MAKHQIKGLTLHGPWTHAILYAGKDIENRNWKCPLQIGDYIALHAGKVYDWDGAISIGLITRELGRPYTPPVERDYKAGFIYGVAQFGGNVTESDSPWFFGKYGWTLTNVVAIEPVACRGAQKLFELPSDVLAQVRRNYKAATEQPAIDESIIADSEPLRPEITQSMIYADIDAMDEAYYYPTIPTEQERAERAARMAAMPTTPYVGVIDDSEPWPLTPAERLRAIREGRIAPEPRSAEDWGAL